MSDFPKRVENFLDWTKRMVKNATVDKPSKFSTKSVKGKKKRKRRRKRRRSSATD